MLCHLKNLKISIVDGSKKKKGVRERKKDEALFLFWFLFFIYTRRTVHLNNEKE